MTAITVNTDRVAPIKADRAEIVPFIAAETIVRGAPVFIQTTTGKLLNANAAAAATAAFAGFALSSGAAGQAIDVLVRGEFAGYDVSGMTVGDPAYLADGGGLDTAAGTTSVVTSRVIPMTDNALTQVLYVNADLAGSGAFAAGA